MQADAAWYANTVAVVAVVISGVALVVAGLSALWTLRQTRATERQADEATNARLLSESALAAQAEALREQSKDTAAALQIAERNARAAEQSAEATKALAETGQRAWLSYEGLSVSSRNRHQTPAYVISILRNSGSTPALKVEMVQCWRMYREIPDKLDFSTGSFGTRGAIGPNSTSEMPFELLIDDDVEIRRASEHLFVYGSARYEDVFGMQHKTDWCLVYVPSIQAFRFTPNFNESS